jgi:hypothetical protein
MDFSAGGYVMSHAVSRAKPWRRRYLVDGLRGYPPGAPHKLYWENCESPINLFSLRRRVTTKIALAIASAIARFYARR